MEVSGAGKRLDMQDIGSLHPELVRRPEGRLLFILVTATSPVHENAGRPQQR